jgi:uncharacterized protein YifE (UPF0438 family)
LGDGEIKAAAEAGPQAADSSETTDRFVNWKHFVFSTSLSQVGDYSWKKEGVVKEKALAMTRKFPGHRKKQ